MEASYCDSALPRFVWTQRLHSLHLSHSLTAKPSPKGEIVIASPTVSSIPFTNKERNRSLFSSARKGNNGRRWGFCRTGTLNFDSSYVAPNKKHRFGVFKVFLIPRLFLSEKKKKQNRKICWIEIWNYGCRVTRESLKPGDHIYSWRTAYIYAHHGSPSSLFCFVFGSMENEVGFPQ